MGKSVTIGIFNGSLCRTRGLTIRVSGMLKAMRNVRSLKIVHGVNRPRLHVRLGRGRLTHCNISGRGIRSVVRVTVKNGSTSLLCRSRHGFGVVIHCGRRFHQGRRRVNGVLMPTVSNAVVPVGRLTSVQAVAKPLLVFHSDRTHFYTIGFSMHKHTVKSTITRTRGGITTSMRLPSKCALG